MLSPIVMAIAPLSCTDSMNRASDAGPMKAVNVRPAASTCHPETRWPLGTRLPSRVPATPWVARSSRNRMIFGGIMGSHRRWCDQSISRGRHPVHQSSWAGAFRQPRADSTARTEPDLSALPQLLERDVHVYYRARQRRAAVFHVGQQLVFCEDGKFRLQLGRDLIRGLLPHPGRRGVNQCSVELYEVAESLPGVDVAVAFDHRIDVRDSLHGFLERA